MSKHNAKRVAVKLQQVIDAWTALRPAKSFGGMTLEQFKAKLQPSLDTRDQLSALKTQTVTSKVQMHQNDTASLDTTQLVVNAVKGDPEEGEDGPLYAAMGYVPKSQRRSGLTRKGQTATATAQAGTAITTAPAVNTTTK